METKYIYKYRELTDSYGHLKSTTLDLILNSVLFFSDPKDFNDDSDADLPLDWSGTKEEIQSFIKACFTNYDCDFLADTILSNETVRQELWKQFKKEGINNRNGSSPKFGLLKVFCASTEYDNSYLWRNYSQDHKGICVGIKKHIKDGKDCIRLNPFLLSSENPYATKYSESMNDTLNLMHLFQGRMTPQADMDGSAYLFPAVYSDEPLSAMRVVDLFSPDDNLSQKFIYHKATKWAKEREVRIVLSQGELPNNKGILAEGEIGEIIFGYLTPEDLVKSVMEMVSQKFGKQVVFYKMKKAPNSEQLVRMVL